MQELELNSARLVRLWWAFTWRFALLYFLIVACVFMVVTLIGAILMQAAGIAEAILAHMAAYALIACLLAALPAAGGIALRKTLNSRMGSFRVALLPRIDPIHPCGGTVMPLGIAPD